MKMKQISAATIQEALAIARRDLGDDAVLLETKNAVRGGGVVVTFAIDGTDEQLFAEDTQLTNDDHKPHPFRSDIPRTATPKIEIDHPAIGLVRECLSYHGLPLSLAQRMLTILHKLPLKPDSLIEVAHTALADTLTQSLAFQPIAMHTIPKRAIMLVGLHGAGKTSALAKLATELTLAKQPVVLISSDRERMGGAESLQQMASILGADFYICENRPQLKILMQQYLGKAWVLIDSAGVNIYEFTQMKGLGELATLQGVEPILTCPAGMDADEAQEMASVFSFLTIERMLVTRLDAVRRLKNVFAALNTGGYALCNLSNSAVPSDACLPLTPIALSRLMLRHTRERMTQ